MVATNGCIFGAGPSCTQAARFDYAQRPAEAILLASNEGRRAKSFGFACPWLRREGKHFVPFEKSTMLNKDAVIKTVLTFPDKFSVDELVDKMILLDKIEKGIQQADNKEVITEEEFDKKLDEWLK